MITMLFCIKQVSTYYNNKYSKHHHLSFAYDLFLFIYAGNINNIELEHDESLLPVMKNKRDSFLISLTTPLWICQNTMKPHEDCVFCKCNQCYMTANETNENSCETNKQIPVFNKMYQSK